MSGDPEQDYFADGITEDIITALSRVRWFFVIARNSTFTYKGRAVDIRQVGRELGVRYVLEGSVRKAGQRVRITGQLIEAETGHHVWADRFDGDLNDIFELQDRITESVVGAVDPTLQRAEIQRAEAKPTENLDAYDLYLKAQPHYYEMTRSGYAAALDLLNKAVHADPNFNLAKGVLAVALVTHQARGWGTPEGREQALSLAYDVIAKGWDDPLALRGAAHAIAYFASDFDQALLAIDRALALNPNSAQVLNSAGWIYCYACEAARAKACFEKAIRISPLDFEMTYIVSGLSFAHLVGREYEAALEVQKSPASQVPNWSGTYRLQVWALVRLGRMDEARVAAACLLQLDPGFTISKGVAPMRDAAVRDDYYGALRLAGLPE
jgi:adenylate cyclase